MQRMLATLIALLAIAVPGVAGAAVCSSTASGVWTDPVWGGACPAGGPTAADDVTINLAHAITFYAGAGSYAAQSLTFSAPGGGASLTHQAAQLLTIGVGGVTFNSSSNTDSTKAWNINDGSATVNGPVTLLEGSANNARIAQINLTTGTLDVNGNLTMTAGNAARTVLAATGAANIFLSGNFTLSSGFGTLSPGATSTFAYDTAAAATVATGSAISYRNLTINKPGVTATGAATGGLTVLGALSVVAGTLSVSNAIAITGATSVNGTFTNTTATGAKTFAGGVTINPGGTFSNNTVVAPVTIGGDFNNSGTLNSGTGTYTFNTAGNWGGSNPIPFGGAVTVSAARAVNTTVSVTGTLAITGAVVVTNNSTVTASGAITGTAPGSTWTNAANSTLNVSGVMLATGTLNTSAISNTVNYAGAAQAVKLPSGAPASYYNLTFSGSGAKTMPATAMTIVNDLTLSGTATTTAAQALSLGRNLVIGASNTFSAATFAHSIGGNFTHNGTFNANTSTFTFNGSAAQTLDGTAPSTTFANLTMSNTAAYANRKLTINHDITVSTLLTFSVATNTGGRIVTSGATKVIIPAAGNITNATGSSAESNFIAGRLQRFIATGASVVAFPVGSNGPALPAAGYSPASLSFAGVAAGGGSLIVFVGTPLGDHPNIATSGLNPSKSVNRWWGLTTTGVSGTALPAFASYGATFTFIDDVAPAGDRDSSAYASNFEIERWNGATWNATTIGARTANTTQATGLTVLAEFAIAEKTAVTPPPGDFNVFETATAGGAITGRIFTKLAGTNFSLDVVAILAGVQDATNNNTVQVDLVTGSTGGLNCPGTPVAIAGTSQNVTLAAGRKTTGNFNVAAAAPNVRVRVQYLAQKSCSTDNFSIRPTGFTVTSSDATQTSFTGIPAIKTGANFNLTAASVTGYNGTPSVDSTKVAGTPIAGTIGGSFSAAPAGTGTASGNSFFYSEVGNFGLNANAIYDSSFTSVDQPGDCTADFSNAPVGGKYGCFFGSTAIAQVTGVSGFGRFIPDNFGVSYNTPSFATACGTFGYTGKAFSYLTAPVITVTARNGTNNSLPNATTTNYTGSYMKLSNASLTPATQGARYSRFDALGGGTTPALDTTGLLATTSDPAIGTFTSGTGDLTFGSGTGLAFSRSTTTPHVPFNADIALSINVIDGDGVAFAGNPASFAAATSGNGIAFNSGKQMRYGRLRLLGAYGSELLDIRLPVRAEYYAGPGSWPVNSLDNCTSLPGSSIALGNYIAPPAGTAVSAANMGVAPTDHRPAGAINLSAGSGTIVLAKPSPVATGTFDVVLNLGTGVVSPNSCVTGAFAGGAVTSLGYLLGNWCGAAYDRAPSARVKLGSPKAPYIYLRERY